MGLALGMKLELAAKDRVAATAASRGDSSSDC